MFLFVHGEAEQGWKETEDQRQRGAGERFDRDLQKIQFLSFTVTFWPVWFLLWFSDSKEKPVLVKHRVGYYRENEGTGQRALSIFGFKVMLQYRRWLLTIQTTFSGSLYLSDQTFFPNQTGLRHLLDKHSFTLVMFLNPILLTLCYRRQAKWRVGSIVIDTSKHFVVMLKCCRWRGRRRIMLSWAQPGQFCCSLVLGIGKLW